MREQDTLRPVTHHRHECSSDTIVRTLDRANRPESDHSLGPAQWAVVDMARADGPRGARPRGFIGRLLHLLIGIPGPRPLANRKLETLRSFAIAAWFADEIPTRQMRAIFAAGFSSNDAARIINYVAAARGTVPEVEAWP